MKTSVLLIASVLLPFGLCSGQAPAPVIDSSVLSAINSLKTDSNTALSAANLALDKLVKFASDYGTGSGSRFPDDVRKIRDVLTGVDDGLTKKIQKISDVLGNPADPKTMKNFDDVKTVIQHWIDDGKLPDNPKYDKGIDDPSGPDDGAKAFSTTGDGLFNFNIDGHADIGSTYKPDPNKTDTEPRDKKLYVGAVNQLAAVKHYYDIRDEALKRRDDLQSLLKETLDEIKKSEDFATMAKQTALIETIQSQIKVCNDDINTAYNDVAVRSLQTFTMSQIKTIADNEAMGKQLKDRTDKAKDLTPAKASAGSGGSGGGSGSGTTSGGFFPWVTHSY